jgi:hypothetical protein
VNIPSIFELPPLTSEERTQVQIVLNMADMLAERDDRISELEMENEHLRIDAMEAAA